MPYLQQTVGDLVEDMRNAETVEDAMRIKRDILHRWVDSLPIYSTSCYFCRVYEEDCNRCPYAKNHGICAPIDDEDLRDELEYDLTVVLDSYELSDWRKINVLTELLHDFILENYYRDGETYD